MLCMIQKTRRRPWVGIAFRAKTTMRGTKSSAAAISLMVVRAYPRGRSAEAPTAQTEGNDRRRRSRTFAVLRKAVFLFIHESREVIENGTDTERGSGLRLLEQRWLLIIWRLPSSGYASVIWITFSCQRDGRKAIVELLRTDKLMKRWRPPDVNCGC